jgi:4-amino-4-deoxy-L-arabinose transferase-like glycosyltransferase
LGYDSVAADHLEVDRDRTGSRQALDYAVHHAGREVTLLVRKTWQLVHHDHEGVLAADSYGEQPVLPSAVGTVARLTADVSWWILVVFAALGVRLLWKRGSEHGRIVIGLAGVLLAMPLVFFGNARFHVPAEPFLAIAASAALTSGTISQSPRHRRSY